MNKLDLNNKVLVVADATYGDYLKVLLTRAGYQVTMLDDISKASNLTDVQQFALVLIDQHYNTRSFLLENFCIHLRRSDENNWYRVRPIIVVYHGPSDENVEAMLNIGVDDVICTPVFGNELVACVRGALHRLCEIEAVYADKFSTLAASLMRNYDDARLELEADIKSRVYRELTYSVSEGRFILLSHQEFDDYLRHTDPPKAFDDDLEVCIDNQLAVDLVLDRAERAFDEYAELHPEQPFSEDDMNDMLVCASELACNVIKHGGGLGSMNINVNEEDVRIYVGDCGEGISEAFLANAIFMGGASSRRSFGFGFSILYKLVDFLIMTTSRQGTRILLVKERAKVEQPVLADEILARF